MLNMNRASIKAIATALHVDRFSAREIKAGSFARRFKSVDISLEFANEAMNAHGVEAIRGHDYDDRYYGDVRALYVNMGDVYITTVLYDTRKRRWYLTDVGTWAEKQGDKII